MLLFVVAGLALAISGCTTPTPTPTTTPSEKPTVTPEPKAWRWGTIDPASYGYKVSALFVDAIKDDMKKLRNIDFAIIPYSTTTANIKGFCKGEVDSTYIGGPGFKELYTSTGGFANFTCERMPVQSFWAYTMKTFLLIPKEKANEIKSWKDLEGKTVYLTPAGYMNYININEALKIVGVNVTHREVDSKFVCNALQEGTIVATALYTTGTATLPTWGQQLSISCGANLVPLNPSPEEREKLIKAGKLLVEIDAKVYGGEGKVYGIPFFFGFHVGKAMPEEDVYTMLKILESKAKDLAAADAGLKPLENFAEFQYDGVKTMDPKLVPIHPRLAKYLKEKGLWEGEWDAYIAK